jgi:hypothetical protein
MREGTLDLDQINGGLKFAIELSLAHWDQGLVVARFEMDLGGTPNLFLFLSSLR